MRHVVECKTWEDYKRSLSRYSRLPLSRRKQFIFRGLTSSEWPLQTTLDRQRIFRSNDQRSACIESLIAEFNKASYGLPATERLSLTPLGWELLARHHGLPTPILDWTESPWIAAFFAFDDAVGRDVKNVSIWTFDREKFLAKEDFPVRLIDDEDAIRFNLRAIEQRGLFMRVARVDKPVEVLLGDALARFDIPASESKIALADLDEMMVNSRLLFRDLDGAARMATRRVLHLGDD